MSARMNAAEWILLGVLALLWGASFLFYKLLAGQLQPIATVFWRTALAAVMLLLIVHLRGERIPASPRVWSAFAVMGMLNNVVPFALIAWSETHIGSGVAAILNATTPMFAVILGAVAGVERLAANRVVGIAGGLCGVAVLMGAKSQHALNLTDLAQAAVIAAALSYACAGIFGRRFSRDQLSPLVIASGSVSASAIMALPLVLAVSRLPNAIVVPGAPALLPLLGLALLGTTFAYVLYFRILATAGATNLLLVTLLVPVSALALGAFFLGERPSAASLAGLAIIVASLALIDGRILDLSRDLAFRVARRFGDRRGSRSSSGSWGGGSQTPQEE